MKGVQAMKGAQAIAALPTPLTPKQSRNGRYGTQQGHQPKLPQGLARPRVAGPALAASNKTTRRAGPLRADGDETEGAKSSATLVITGGSGSATGSASTESLVTLENAISEAIADAIAEVEGGGSASAVAESTAKAIGSATALAIADASAVVEISGQGTATAAGSASVRSIGKVVAKAVSEATANALGPNVSADTKSRAEVEETRVVLALAKANATAQTTGGTAESFSSMVSEAVVEVVAEAVAIALAEVEEGRATAEGQTEATTDIKDESVFVDSNQDSTATGTGTATGDGSGQAVTDVVNTEPVTPAPAVSTSAEPTQPAAQGTVQPVEASPAAAAQTSDPVAPQVSPAAPTVEPAKPAAAGEVVDNDQSWSEAADESKDIISNAIESLGNFFKRLF